MWQIVRTGKARRLRDYAVYLGREPHPQMRPLPPRRRGQTDKGSPLSRVQRHAMRRSDRLDATCGPPRFASRALAGCLEVLGRRAEAFHLRRQQNVELRLVVADIDRPERAYSRSSSMTSDSESDAPPGRIRRAAESRALRAPGRVYAGKEL